MAPLGFTKDDAYFVAIKLAAMPSRDSIVVVDAQNFRLDTVFSGLAFDRSDGPRCLFDSSSEYIMGVVWEAGYQHLRVWNLRTGKEIRRSLAGRGYRYSDLEFRRKTLSFLHEDFGQPLSLYTWSPELLAADAARIELDSLPAQIEHTSPVDPIASYYTADDGLNIPCYLLLPPKPAASRPFIIYVHGGPHSCFAPYYNPWFHYFLSHGYGILIPNIRGSSIYGSWYRKLDNAEKRLDAIRDIVAGAQWLVEKEFSTHEHIGLWGPSYGGYAVLLAAMEAPNHFGAVAADCPVTDLELMGREDGVTKHAEYGDLTDEALLNGISPIRRAHELNTPTVIIHGDNDLVVSVEHALSFTQRCKELNKPVELLVLPGEGHTFRKPENMHAAFALKAEHFHKHLRDKKSTAPVNDAASIPVDNTRAPAKPAE